MLPEAHWGNAEEPLPDWRGSIDEDPDDEEMENTPPDVIAMLGFDPKDMTEDSDLGLDATFQGNQHIGGAHWHERGMVEDVVEHMPGHKDADGNDAPWVVKSHQTGKVLWSGGSKEEAVEALARIHSFAHDSSLTIDRASLRKVDEFGRMRVDESNISKEQIRPYWGKEIPGYEELGLDPEKQYNMLCPADELKKAADSFNLQPIMYRHPEDPQTADNPQNEKIVGYTGTDARFKNGHLVNSLAFHDGQAIKDIEDEKAKDLSIGYLYKAEMTPGTFEGAHYDGIMRGILSNHIALVPEGRAGRTVVVADSNMKMTVDVQLDPETKALLEGLAQDVAALKMPGWLAVLGLTEDETHAHYAGEFGGGVKNPSSQSAVAKSFEANRLTQEAKTSGQHGKAAHAHSEAAVAHQKAAISQKNAGNEKLASIHMQAAIKHGELSRSHAGFALGHDEANCGIPAGLVNAKDVAKREDVNPKTGKKEYGDVPFADMKNKKYPIDEEHIRNALSRWGDPKNRAQYSPEDQKVIGGRIHAAAKRMGIGQPAASKTAKDGGNMAGKHDPDLEALQDACAKDGDYVGHEFHGNQHAGGSGGDKGHAASKGAHEASKAAGANSSRESHTAAANAHQKAAAAAHAVGRHNTAAYHNQKASEHLSRASRFGSRTAHDHGGHMLKGKLSSCAAMAKGVLITYLRPKLATDAQLTLSEDLNAILKNVTAKRFEAQKNAIVGVVKDRLAKDIDTEELKAKLDDLEEALGEEEDEEEPIDDEPIEVEDGNTSEQILELLKGYDVPAEIVQQVCELVEGKKPTEDKFPPNKKENEMLISAKPAMDAEAVNKVVSDAVAAAEKRGLALDQAKRDVAPLIGEVYGQKTAADVYKLALDAKKVDYKDVPPEAYQALIKLIPVPRAGAEIPITADAVTGSPDLINRYPHLANIRIAG